MANDRMYIRCKGCGDLHFLAKCYDDGYFTTHEGEELRQGLDDFFDRHKWCYRDKYYGGFELVYESDEDAENEDERIIDDAIQIIRASRLRCAEYGSEADKHLKAIAWLEKQKEPENTSASTMAPSCWEVEQKEQKPVEPSDDELQRHQDELYDFKVFATKQAKEHHISFVHDFEWNNFCAELLSYFNEQKPEWSEEDEKDLAHIIRILDDCYAFGMHNLSKTNHENLVNKLKSLRPSWKPSEELMGALRRAVNKLAKTDVADSVRLSIMYDNLKKL